MMLRSSFLLIASVLLLASASGSWGAPAAADAAPARPLSVEVRNATLGSVVRQMAEVGGARMQIDPDVGDQRVTIHAPRTDVDEFRRAVATLLGLRWREGSGGASVLERDPEFGTRVLALQRRRDSHFLRRLLETATAMAAGGEEVVARVREEFQRRHPELDAATMNDINADFLRQSLLLTPLTPSLQGQLLQAGWVSVPIHRLAPAHQQMMALFAARGGTRELLGLPGGTPDVTLPNARVTYRLLYGDRWTDTLLWSQVGAPGGWATAILPSILFRQEDGSDAYPQVKERPNDAEVWRRTPGRFDPAGKSWDRVLMELGAAMNLKIASDSYLRPAVFDVQTPARPIAGIPLRMALDRLAEDRGMFWWKEGDWYYFRSRTWLEEARVAVPDRLLQGWIGRVRQAGRLSGVDLDPMGGLSEEQLITLNLIGRASRQPASSLAAFDPNDASLAATSLLLFRSLGPVQREQALAAEGLPALWMSPAQQNLYSAIAAEYGYALEPDEAGAWGFRIEQSWNAPPAAEAPNRPPPPQPVTGQLRFRWSFGPDIEEVAEIHLSDAGLRGER